MNGDVILNNNGTGAAAAVPVPVRGLPPQRLFGTQIGVTEGFILGGTSGFRLPFYEAARVGNVGRLRRLCVTGLCKGLFARLQFERLYRPLSEVYRSVSLADQSYMMHGAVVANRPEVVEFLLSFWLGNGECHQGLRGVALLAAAEQGRSEIAQFVLDNGDVSQVFLDDAVQAAAYFNHSEIKDELLRRHTFSFEVLRSVRDPSRLTPPAMDIVTS